MSRHDPWDKFSDDMSDVEHDTFAGLPPLIQNIVKKSIRVNPDVRKMRLVEILCEVNRALLLAGEKPIEFQKDD